MNGQRPSALRDSWAAQWIRPAVCLITIACVLSSGLGQARAQSSDVTVTVEEVDTSTLPATRIRVSVRDRNGVPIQDLTAEHFEIVEDGAAAFVPTSVQAETHPEAQVSLAIVIDLYRTLAGKPIEAAQEATQDLITDLLDQPDDADRAAFIGVREGLSTDPSEIDDTYEVSFTNDRNRLLNVINFLHERIQHSGPGTPLYDAVIKAIRMAEASEPVAHRAVVVMTDGEDRGSVSEDSDTIQRASDARTPVFTVGLSQSGLDEQYLRRLAENTGGTYQAAQAPDDLSSLFANVLTMLRTQYVLSYESGLPQDGQTHSVLVRVRTPTQLRGFQEYRVAMPGGATGDVEEEAAPTSESPPADSEAGEEPAPSEEEGWLTTARDWVEDNLLLALFGVGAVGLFFLGLVIVAVIVVRRRRVRAEERYPMPEAPSYPSVPEFGFDSHPGGAKVDADDPGFDVGGLEPAPSPTVTDDERPFGVGPWPRYEEPPAAPAGYQQPVFEPSSEDRTRILQHRPKMSRVGLLIDRDRPEHRLDVAKPTVTIGRSQENDLVVDHNTISRRHAVIKLENQQFQLHDTGSTNGTFVGDERVREPVSLEDGAVVAFGEKAFIFKIISLGT